jgi:hypothetical protein
MSKMTSIKVVQDNCLNSIFPLNHHKEGVDSTQMWKVGFLKMSLKTLKVQKIVQGINQIAYLKSAKIDSNISHSKWTL